MRVERGEQKVQKEDDGKGTRCPAPNREEKQEAVAVIERDTAKTKLLNLSQETAAKCEVLLLLLSPCSTDQQPPTHNATITTAMALCSAAAKRYTHTHTHTHIKSAQVEPSLQLILWRREKINFSLKVKRHTALKEL